MKVLRQFGIALCVTVLGVSCVVGGCAICIGTYMGKKEEEKKQWEARKAAYPNYIESYLEEKYGREFCVNSRPRGGGGSPIPFVEPDYVTFKYKAWEDEEDGYAFWTEVYPVSLKDNRILKVEDSYCWKFISRKIEEELKEKLKEITEEAKIIILPRDDFMIGEEIDEHSGIKEAIKSLKPDSTINIYIIFPPGLRLSEAELNRSMEKIANDFYNKYVEGSLQWLDVHVFETDTEEDYFKIEPEKTEQYWFKTKESEYEDKDWLPVEINPKTRVEIKPERGSYEGDR